MIHGGIGFGGLFLLKKAFFLVVLSFFVLLGASKADSEGLKKFGKVLAVIMWALALAAVVLVGYKTVTGTSCGSMKYGRQPTMPMQEGQTPMMPPTK